MRLGIYGGSFNPFHYAHLWAGCSAAEAFALDKVLLMPCYLSPFKIGNADELVDGATRVEMIQAAIADDPLFGICDVELKRKGVSYAVDSVEEIQRLYKDAELYFIIGMDSLLGLSHWHDASRLVGLCNFITLSRPDSAMPTAEQLGFPAATAQRLLANIIHGRNCELSSSEIRQRVRDGLSIRHLVPEGVRKIIEEKKLYQRKEKENE